VSPIEKNPGSTVIDKRNVILRVKTGSYSDIVFFGVLLQD